MGQKISVMTYNVHSCVGLDGRSSPLRIAEVISRENPDIVALQELDCELSRTGFVDQARVIAAHLEMSYHFHPCLSVERGRYGNAIFSRYPMRLVRAAALPGVPRRPQLEKRGALWAEIHAHRRKFQVLNTHLGLNWKERLAQSRTLLGPQWLKNTRCRPPVIFCGDLNAFPSSPVYRGFRQVLVDAQGSSNSRRPEKTWPSRLPLFRLDYVFISPDLRVLGTRIPRTRLARMASDHLPLVIELALDPAEKREGAAT